MGRLWLSLTTLWILLFLWRVFADPYPSFLPYALIGVIGLGVAFAFLAAARRLLMLPEALFDQLEVE
jgi:hypothetical protein